MCKGPQYHFSVITAQWNLFFFPTQITPLPLNSNYCHFNVLELCFSLPFTAYFVFHIGYRQQFSHGYMFLVDNLLTKFAEQHITSPIKGIRKLLGEGGLFVKWCFWRTQSRPTYKRPRQERSPQINSQFFDSPVDSLFIGQLRYSACHPEIIGPYFTPTFTAFAGVLVDSHALMLAKTFFFRFLLFLSSLKKKNPLDLLKSQLLPKPNIYFLQEDRFLPLTTVSSKSSRCGYKWATRGK